MPDSQIVFILVFGTLGTLLITVSLILFVISYQKRNLANKLKLQSLETQHQKALTESSFKGQEKERGRIAKDLHDDVGSMLSATKLQMNFIKMKVRDSPELTRLVDESLETISGTISEVRTISRNLAPHLLNSLGLAKSIEYLLETVRKSGKFEVRFNETGSSVSLGNDIEINLYRSVQELINNAVKHSKATDINVGLNWHENGVEIEISDNGSGFDIASLRQNHEHGIGLMNIESRLDIIGAEFKMQSSGQGTVARIFLETREPG